MDHYFETPIDESGMRPGKNCVDPMFQSVFYGKREVHFIVDYKETEWRAVNPQFVYRCMNNLHTYILWF